MADTYAEDLYEIPALVESKPITGAAERKKVFTKKLATDECLKILVKYNNILNIKWSL